MLCLLSRHSLRNKNLLTARALSALALIEQHHPTPVLAVLLRRLGAARFEQLTLEVATRPARSLALGALGLVGASVAAAGVSSLISSGSQDQRISTPPNR